MVYFAHAGGVGPFPGFVKIGYSKNPLQRLEFIVKSPSSVVCPNGLNLRTVELLGCIEGDRSVELRLHDEFKLNRHRGEWFVATPGMLSAIWAILKAVGVKIDAALAVGRGGSVQHCDGNESWLSPAGVARLLNVTRRTVYRWLESGQLPAVQHGRTWRVSPQDIDKRK